MKKDNIEFLFLDDNDDFEDDFMLNNKNKKREVVESLNDDSTSTKIDDDKTEELSLDDIVIEKIDNKEEKAKENKNKDGNIKKEEVNKQSENKEISQKISNDSKKHKKDKKTKEKKPKKEKKEKKQISKKVFYSQLVFCLISILFVIGCCIFYGCRLVKYYKMYNPKTETGESITLIGASLTDGVAYQTEGDGLYRLNGSSVYKGLNVDNYIKFSDMLWRIISINTDGTLDIISDESINTLMFNESKSSFENSDILAYLNEKFLPLLNKELLTVTPYCKDEVAEMKVGQCKEMISSQYIRLLSLSEFVNAKTDSSYLVSSYDYWLNNISAENAWHTNLESLSLSSVNDTYAVKPVVRLKNTNVLLGGKGTKDEPYYIEKENNDFKIGKYIKLGEDNWVIYEMDETTLTLALNVSIYNVLKFSSSKNTFDVSDKTSVAYYLNNTYLESLSYKNIINNYKWNIGKYEKSYKDVENLNTEAKVGMYSVSDLKIGNIDKMYYLLTPSKTGYVYFYDGDIIESKVSYSRNIIPTININKFKISSGAGSIDNPFILEWEE